MVESFIELNEPPVEDFIDLTETATNVPISEVELNAAIATLAAKRIKNLAPDQVKNEHDRYYDLSMRHQDDLIRSELTSLKMNHIYEMSNDVLQQAMLAGDTELVKGITDVNFALNPETEKFSVIEKEAAEEIIDGAAKDSDRALQMQVEPPEGVLSMEDITSEILAEKLLLTKVIRKYSNKLDLDMKTIGSAAAMLIPGADSAIMSQKIKTMNNPILTGDDIDEQRAAYQAMSLSEKAETIKRIEEFFDQEAGKVSLGDIAQGAGNDLAAMIYFQYLNEFTTFDYVIEQTIPILDALVITKPLIGLVKTIGLGAKISQALTMGKVATASIISGNRIAAIDQVHQVREAVKAADIAYDSEVAANAGELLLETQLLPIGELARGQAGISGRLEKELQDIEKITQQITEAQPVPFLDVVERSEVLNVYREQVASQQIDAGVRHLDILKVIDEDITQGVEGIKYHLYYGDINGLGFPTAKVASEYADLLKLDGATVSASKDLNGTYFLEFTKRVSTPAGFIQTYKGIDEAGGIRRYLSSPTNMIGITEANLTHLPLAIRENAMVGARELVKYINKLSSSEKVALGEVMESGRNKNVWFEPSTLINTYKLNESQVAAYSSLRRMDDINHVAINGAEYNRKDRIGLKTIELTNIKALQKGLPKEFDAQPLNAIPAPENKSIYNVSTGEYLNTPTVKELETLQKNGYTFLGLEGARETDSLDAIQYIVGKGKDLKVKELDFNQVEYKAGGRVDYENAYFVKQARVRYRGESKPAILLKSRTYGVATKAEADEYVVKMEAARKIVLANDGVNVDLQISEATGGLFNKAEDFIDYVGAKNLNNAFEAVQDNQELTEAMVAVAKGASHHPRDLAEANSVQRMISRGGDSKSKRGERLDGLNGKTAPVVNPLESASKSLERAIETMSIDTWKARQIEKFTATFGAVLKGDKSAMGHFMNPEFIDLSTIPKSSPLQGLLKQAKVMQKHYASVLNTPTTGDRFFKETFMAPISDILETVSKKIGKPLRDETLTNVANMNPINFVRSLAYHSHLGLFNLKQPAIQIQATALMISANPVNGVKAAFLGMPMRLMLASDNAQTLGALAKSAGKIIGMKGDEVKELYDILQRSGTWRLKSGALAEQELKGLSSSTIFQKFLDYGQAPFLETERYNKIAATMSAAMDWRKANPKATITDDVINQIRAKSEFYTANMNRVDRASYQTGLTSIPFQYWGYQSRAMEMMLPTIAGGSKNFTGAQKLRMAVSQLGLYGVGGATSPRLGLRFRDAFGQMYEEQFKEAASEAFLDTLEGGLIESILANAMGVDVAFGNRGGLGLTSGGWGEVVTNLVTMDFKELQKMDAAGLSVLGKIAPNIYALMKIINPAAEYFGTKEQLTSAIALANKGLRETVSSYSGVERAYIAVQLGMHLDRLGKTTDKNSTTTEVILGLLGLDPSNATDKRAMKEALKGSDSLTKTTTDLLVRQLNIAMKTIDKEDFQIAFKRFEETRKFMFSIMNEQQRKRINTQVLSKSRNDTQSIIKRYYREFGVLKDLTGE